MNIQRKNLFSALLIASVLFTILPAIAANQQWDGSKPPQGVYFHWYEPSFYAGFAPRIDDPARVHMELARGNQVRVTIVLDDTVIDNYLDDLIKRQTVYQTLIDRGVMKLSTNKAYEGYVEGLKAAGVEALIAEKEGLGAEAYRQKSIELLAKLNPQRIFQIRMPIERVTADWHTVLAALSDDDLKSLAKRLDAANAVLPGRVNLYQMSDELTALLRQAVAQAHAGGAETAEFKKITTDFIAQATNGHYAINNGNVEALEFTSIYPVGTAQSWVNYKGKRLPAFGVHGVWHLIPRIHGKGYMGMVDYLSKNPGYGFIPMLGYQYAGGPAYNALHNAGVRSNLGGTRFLPKEWRQVKSERNPDKKYQNLWIVSRGPTSHGCTRMGSGHVSELRHGLPASSETMEQVAYYRNLPQCYDIFDINGDGKPEVMGVKYYMAYSTTGHTPKAAYAPNTRKPFYQWLYGDNVRYTEEDHAVLKEVLTCRFVGIKKATEAQSFKDIPLYEASYIPEPIQFYLTKPVDFQTRKGFAFNRELRKVGVAHESDRKALLLD